jgi:hypothetical protein
LEEEVVFVGAHWVIRVKLDGIGIVGEGKVNVILTVENFVFMGVGRTRRIGGIIITRNTSGICEVIRTGEASRILEETWVSYTVRLTKTAIGKGIFRRVGDRLAAHLRRRRADRARPGDTGYFLTEGEASGGDLPLERGFILTEGNGVG